MELSRDLLEESEVEDWDHQWIMISPWHPFLGSISLALDVHQWWYPTPLAITMERVDALTAKMTTERYLMRGD